MRVCLRISIRSSAVNGTSRQFWDPYFWSLIEDLNGICDVVAYGRLISFGTAKKPLVTYGIHVCASYFFTSSHVCIDDSSLNALRGIDIMSNMELKSFKIHAWRGLSVPGKMCEKVVADEGLGTESKGEGKKVRKMGSSWEGAHAIRLRLRSRNIVFGFEKKKAECIQNDMQNKSFWHLF